jgi:hypothetical protein
VKVTDEPTLRQVRDAYASKYDWPLTIQGGTFFAPYGGPSSLRRLSIHASDRIRSWDDGTVRGNAMALLVAPPLSHTD